MTDLTTFKDLNDNQKLTLEAMIAGKFEDMKDALAKTNGNFMTEENEPFLFMASKQQQSKQYEYIEALLERGADINAKDGKAWTLLHHVAISGDRDLIFFLIGKGADATINAPLSVLGKEINVKPSRVADSHFNVKAGKLIEAAASHEKLWNKNNHNASVLQGLRNVFTDFITPVHFKFLGKRSQKLTHPSRKADNDFANEMISLLEPLEKLGGKLDLAGVREIIVSKRDKLPVEEGTDKRRSIMRRLNFVIGKLSRLEREANPPAEYQSLYPSSSSSTPKV